jgi:hypothetical protein
MVYREDQPVCRCNLAHLFQQPWAIQMRFQGTRRTTSFGRAPHDIDLLAPHLCTVQTHSAMTQALCGPLSIDAIDPHSTRLDRRLRIPLELIEHIFILLFSSPRPTIRNPSPPPPNRNTSHLLLISHHLRRYNLPLFYRSITIARPDDWETFFGSQRGLLVVGKEGKKRAGWVKDLWVHRTAGVPIDWERTDCNEPSPILVDLSFPRLELDVLSLLSNPSGFSSTDPSNADILARTPDEARQRRLDGWQGEWAGDQYVDAPCRYDDADPDDVESIIDSIVVRDFRLLLAERRKAARRRLASVTRASHLQLHDELLIPRRIPQNTTEIYLYWCPRPISDDPVVDSREWEVLERVDHVRRRQRAAVVWIFNWPLEGPERDMLEEWGWREQGRSVTLHAGREHGGVFRISSGKL